MKAGSRRASQNKRYKTILVAAAVALLLWYLVPATVSMVASALIYPVVSIERWLADSGSAVPAYVRDRKVLLSQLQEAEATIAAQGGADLTIDRLQKENDALRALLGASTTERIAAGVIARPPAVPYDVMVLDRGERDGIVLNAPVFSGRDQVIGHISKVYKRSAVVTLASAPGVESTVYLIGPDIYTSAVGEGGGVLRVGVPQGIPIAPGDLVVIPSFDAGVYGLISAVNSEPTRPQQYGYVTLDRSLQSIRWVAVGQNPVSADTFDEIAEIVDEILVSATTVELPASAIVAPTSTGPLIATSTEELPL